METTDLFMQNVAMIIWQSDSKEKLKTSNFERKEYFDVIYGPTQIKNCFDSGRDMDGDTIHDLWGAKKENGNLKYNGKGSKISSSIVEALLNEDLFSQMYQAYLDYYTTHQLDDDAINQLIEIVNAPQHEFMNLRGAQIQQDIYDLFASKVCGLFKLGSKEYICKAVTLINLAVIVRKNFNEFVLGIDSYLEKIHFTLIPLCDYQPKGIEDIYDLAINIITCMLYSTSQISSYSKVDIQFFTINTDTKIVYLNTNHLKKKQTQFKNEKTLIASIGNILEEFIHKINLDHIDEMNRIISTCQNEKYQDFLSLYNEIKNQYIVYLTLHKLSMQTISQLARKSDDSMKSNQSYHDYRYDEFQVGTMMNRENELAILENFIVPKTDAEIQWMAVTGGIGVGKKKLIYEFYKRFRENNKDDLFFYLSNPKDIDVNTLCNQNKNILIVFESFDDYMKEIGRFLDELYAIGKNNLNIFIRIIFIHRGKHTKKEPSFWYDELEIATQSRFMERMQYSNHIYLECDEPLIQKVCDQLKVDIEDVKRIDPNFSSPMFVRFLRNNADFSIDTLDSFMKRQVNNELYRISRLSTKYSISSDYLISSIIYTEITNSNFINYAHPPFYLECIRHINLVKEYNMISNEEHFIPSKLGMFKYYFVLRQINHISIPMIHEIMNHCWMNSPYSTNYYLKEFSKVFLIDSKESFVSKNFAALFYLPETYIDNRDVRFSYNKLMNELALMTEGQNEEVQKKVEALLSTIEQQQNQLFQSSISVEQYFIMYAQIKETLNELISRKQLGDVDALNHAFLSDFNLMRMALEYIRYNYLGYNRNKPKMKEVLLSTRLLSRRIDQYKEARNQWINIELTQSEKDLFNKFDQNMTLLEELQGVINHKVDQILLELLDDEFE